MMFGSPVKPATENDEIDPTPLSVSTGAGLPKVTVGTPAKVGAEKVEGTLRVETRQVLEDQDPGVTDPTAAIVGHAETVVAQAPSRETDVVRAPPGLQDADAVTTLPPDGGQQFNIRATMPHQMQPELPGDGPVHDQVNLPPEPMFTQGPDAGLIGEAPGAPDEAAEAIMAAARRRNMIALGVIVVVILIVGGFLAFKLLGKFFSQDAVGAESRQALDTAVARLRRDDDASKKESIEALQGLVTRSPEFVEAKAALVLALAVDFDDQQQELLRLQKAFAQVKNRHDADLKQGAAADKLAAAETDLANLKTRQEALGPKVEQARVALTAAEQSMSAGVPADLEQGSPVDLAVLRARAMFKAVGGSDEALTLAGRHRGLSKSPDSWIAIVDAEYYANATTTPDSRAQAIAGLQALERTESTFIRPYVLTARLFLADEKNAEAEEALGKALALTKNHSVATELSEWIKNRH